MLLPFGDFPNPPKPQWVTRILIGLNVAIYLFISLPLDRPLTAREQQDPEVRAQLEEMLRNLAQDVERRQGRPPDAQELAIWASSVTRYDLFIDRYGYKPGDPSLLALLLCMFLHANFLHLAGNMLYLYIFGDNIEWRLGLPGYLAAYLGTGVVATLSFAAFSADSLTPLVGASGAISGVLGFYLIWFPFNQVRVLLLFVFIMVVHIRAIWVLLAYLVIDNLVPFIVQRSGAIESNVAYGAHLGGFVAGMGGAFLLNRVRGKLPAPRPRPYVERRSAPWVRPRERKIVEDPVGAFREALRAGRMEDAAHAFSRQVQEGGPRPAPEDVFRLARWLYDNGFVPDTAAVFRYYIANYPNGADLDRVHLGLGVLLGRRMGQPAAAREHLLNAIDLAHDPATAEIARRELATLEP